jgi:hypothetical protein
MVQVKRQPPSRGMVDVSLDLVAPVDLATKAILDGLDDVVARMERKWGVGRLRLLVGDELRIRFDAQKAKLDAALASNQPGYVRAQAPGMQRAWLALDRAAAEAGAKPLSPQVWECVLPSSGEVVSIVRTAAEAHHVAREGEVWTVGELGVLIERLGDDVRQVKRRFPGSAVVEVRDRDPPPIDWEKGDEIPF